MLVFYLEEIGYTNRVISLITAITKEAIIVISVFHKIANAYCSFVFTERTLALEVETLVAKDKCFLGTEIESIVTHEQL